MTEQRLENILQVFFCMGKHILDRHPEDSLYMFRQHLPKLSTYVQQSKHVFEAPEDVMMGNVNCTTDETKPTQSLLSEVSCPDILQKEETCCLKIKKGNTAVKI